MSTRKARTVQPADLAAASKAGAKGRRRVVHRDVDAGAGADEERKRNKKQARPESDQNDTAEPKSEERSEIQLSPRNSPSKDARNRPQSTIVQRKPNELDRHKGKVAQGKKQDEEIEPTLREKRVAKKRPVSEIIPGKGAEIVREKKATVKRAPAKRAEEENAEGQKKVPQIAPGVIGRPLRAAVSARGPPESSSSDEEESGREGAPLPIAAHAVHAVHVIRPAEVVSGKDKDTVIVRKKEHGKVYVLKHRRRHHPLGLSEAVSVEHYRKESGTPAPVTGVLYAKVNGVDMNPKYEKSGSSSREQKRPPLPPGSGCPAGQANMALRSGQRSLGLLGLKTAPPAEVDDGRLIVDFDDMVESEDDEEVDMTNMPKLLSSSFFEGYKPSEHVSQLTWRDSNIYVPAPIQHCPSLILLSAREGEGEECEEEKAAEVVQRALGSSRGNIPLPPKKPPGAGDGALAIARKLKKPIALNEIQRSSLCMTDPQMAPQWNSIRDQIYNETDQNAIATSALPRSELNQFSLTRSMEPKTSEITYYKRDDGKNYISAIAPDVFMQFKFGQEVTEPNPDQLHIFIWHNLGISATVVANNLADVVDKMKDGNADVEKMKCVAQYLFIWVSLWASDFANNQEAGAIIIRMLNQMTRKSRVNNKVNQEIGEYAMRLRGIVSALKEKKQAPEKFTVPLPKEAVKIKSLRLPSYDISECTIDPAVLVRHFTYLDLQNLMSVQRIELVRKNWTEGDIKEKASPNIMKLTRRFDAAGAMVATSIMVATPKARAKNITYWITCMEEARKQRNYQLLFEIDSGLCCLPVNRLEQSWKLVNKKKIASFNHLHHITEPTRKGLLKYKTEIMEDRQHTVPFIGPFLRDLVYVWDGNKQEETMPNGQKGYNINFQRAYQEAVQTIVQDWGRDMTFQIDKELLARCRELKSKYASSEQLIGPSTQLEPPRDNEADFIRKYRK